MRPWRLLAHGAALFLLLFLSLAGVLYWLVATEPGLRWLAGEIEANVAGVAIGAAEGALVHGFTLRKLGYRDETLDLKLDVLELVLEPADLWRGLLHLRSVRADGLAVAVTGKSESAEPPAWPEWTLPLALALDDFRLDRGTLKTAPEAEPLRIDRLAASLYAGAEGLRITRLDLAMPEAAAQVSGTAGFAGERAVKLETAWQLKLPNRPAIQGSGTVTGNPERLVLKQTLKAPVAAGFTVTLANPLDRLAWTARVEAPKFPLDRIDPGLQPWPIALALEGQGTLAEAAVSGDVSAEVPEAGEIQARLKLRYREPGELGIETLNLVLPRSGSELAVEGKVRGLRDTPAFELAARWKNLIWPPAPEPASRRGRAPGAKREQAAGQVWRSPEGKLKVAGNLKDIRFDLEGLLRDLRVEAGGNIGLERGTTLFRGIRVRGAGTDLAMDGSLGPRLDFTWNLRAEDLSLWLPGAGGRVESKGRLQGTRVAPAAEAELAARGLRYGDQGVAELRLNLKAGLQPDSPFAFDLSARDLSAAGQTLSAALSGQGTRLRHRLGGRIEAKLAAGGGEPVPVRLDFGAEGGLREQVWSGSLARFDFAAAPVGTWDLRRPAALTLGPAGGELGTACWDSGGTDGCLQAKYTGAGDWRLETSLSDLSLSRFDARLPEAVRASGRLGLRAYLAGQGGRVADGWVDLAVADALLEYRATPKETVRFQPRPLALKARISPKGSRFTLEADHPGFATLHGELGIEGPLDPARLRQAPLAGGLRLDLPSLAFLAPWTDDLKDLHGRFDADLRFHGNADAPVVELKADLADAGFGVPRLGIKLRDLELSATSHEGNRIGLRGRMASGEGNLTLDGQATLSAAAGWPVNLNLRGERFLAADIPEARVYVSPDLAIGFETGKVLLKGGVAVPEAFFGIPEREGAVKPSEDVVFVGVEAEKKAVLAIESRLDVILGDKVRVRGAGFEGRVEGQVLIEQAPRSPVLGTGQVTIKEGKYSLYGVELDVNDGRILFARSPVDNPGLQINATRQTDDALVGVKVLGTVKKPVATLYADRPMPQTDILAYLVTGRPFGLTSQQEGGMLQGAAVSLGGSAGTYLAQEIGNRLGLGIDISMQSSVHSGGYAQPYRGLSGSGTTASGSDSTALFLGKYLTPRLYVQYGMGLFQNAYVFRMRYTLTRNWKIQTETGEFSGGDILYQWEK